MKIAIKKIGDVAIPATEADKELWHKFSDAVYSVDMKNLDSRTVAQNRAYWVWCTMIAETLNDNGLYLNDILKMETMWNKDNIHANIMLPVMKNTFNKTSSTKLEKTDYEQVIDVVTKAFAQKGIEIPNFPEKG